MKNIFSSISRLFFAYSKFIVMVTMLSGLSSTLAHSSEATYLKCDSGYYRLTGTYLESNYNIRSKKFTYKKTIFYYGENYIRFGNFERINRNNGEWTSNGKVVRTCKKISRDELPKINQEGKLF